MRRPRRARGGMVLTLWRTDAMLSPRASQDRGLLSLGAEQASPQKGPGQAQAQTQDDAVDVTHAVADKAPPSRPMQAWGPDHPPDPDEQWGGAAAYLDSQRFKS